MASVHFSLKASIKYLGLLIATGAAGLLIWLYSRPVETEAQTNARLFISLVLGILLIARPLCQIYNQSILEYREGQWFYHRLLSPQAKPLEKEAIKSIEFLKFNLPLYGLGHRKILIKMKAGKVLKFHSKEIQGFDQLAALIQKQFGGLLSKKEF